MASLKNVRHEKFAQCVASGLSGADAYRQAAEYSGKQADGNAANWMKRPGVRERIEELKAESSARCSLSREAYIRSLVEMYEAKPGDASMDNPRCDVLITRGQKHAVFPQKLAVGAQLSKLVGWDRPTEVRVEAGTELAAFLGGLFAGGGTLGGNNQSACGWQQWRAQQGNKQSRKRRQALTRRQALEAFRDPVWRLSRLYSIRTRDGSVIKFTPRPQQRQIIDLIYRQGCRRIIILKARQLGFSTLLGVICADRLCFGLGQQISLIDQTIEDARQKLRDIVMVAYDSLDPALKRELPITRSNTGELAVKFVRHEEAKTNAMFAGTHARGGANSFLWISEWGVIQATDLARSEEILTGALPSVGDGVCVVETTWKGGRNGHLWSLVKSALETPEEQKGTARLAGRFLPVARRPELQRRGSAPAWRGDCAVFRRVARLGG